MQNLSHFLSAFSLLLIPFIIYNTLKDTMELNVRIVCSYDYTWKASLVTFFASAATHISEKLFTTKPTTTMERMALDSFWNFSLILRKGFTFGGREMVTVKGMSHKEWDFDIIKEWYVVQIQHGHYA